MVKEDLASAECYAITTDGWTSSVNMNPYISLTVHYITPSPHFKVVSTNLATVYAPGDHTADHLKDLLTEEVKDWGLAIEKCGSAIPNTQYAIPNTGIFRALDTYSIML